MIGGLRRPAVETPKAAFGTTRAVALFYDLAACNSQTNLHGWQGGGGPGRLVLPGRTATGRR